MSLPGTLHRFYDKLVAFEHAPSSGPYSSKIILFVGGLGDSISTVAYLKQLVPKVLEQGWGFVEMLTSSSWDGWGNGSLTRDGDEIAAAVQYLRENATKLPLFSVAIPLAVKISCTTLPKAIQALVTQTSLAAPGSMVSFCKQECPTAKPFICH